jgi:hypothetical protein
MIFLSGCAISAQGADDAEVVVAAPEPTVEASYADEDPVRLVNRALADEFGDAAIPELVADIVSTEGIVTVVLTRRANTLSGAELYLRVCTAAAAYLNNAAAPSLLNGVGVIQADGRTIAAATVEQPTCFYR